MKYVEFDSVLSTVPNQRSENRSSHQSDHLVMATSDFLPLDDRRLPCLLGGFAFDVALGILY